MYRKHTEDTGMCETSLCRWVCRCLDKSDVIFHFKCFLRRQPFTLDILSCTKKTGHRFGETHFRSLRFDVLTFLEHNNICDYAVSLIR